MRDAHVPAGDGEAGRGGVTFALATQLVAVALHLLAAISLPRSITATLAIPYSPGTGGAQQAARWVGLLVSAAWVLGGLVWGSINAWGIAQRRPWSFSSTRAYFWSSLLTVCCLPFGAAGLWALSRPGVRERLSGGA